MADLTLVDGPYLQQVLDHSYPLWHEGLSREGYGRYYTAQVATPWGRTHLQRLALVENGDVLASAKLYTFDAVLDGVSVRIAGIGAPRRVSSITFNERSVVTMVSKPRRR